MQRRWVRRAAAVVALSGLIAGSNVARAADAPYLSPTTAFGPITASGNCSTNGTLEQPPRDAADAQLADFLTATGDDDVSIALFPDGDLGSLGVSPYTLPIPSTPVTVSIALNNMTPADTSGATSTDPMSWGTPSTGTAPSLFFGSTDQLQDCAVKPTRLTVVGEGGPLPSPTAYWGASGFGNAADQSTLDSVLFTFSEPVDNFGAWFGDLETRADDAGGGDGGELAHVKLYDPTGTVLSVQPVVPTVQTPIAAATPFGCGGPSGADTSACGNHGTRFIGFTWDTPDVAAFQVIVGDDDNCNDTIDCDGFEERFSFIGPTMAFDRPELTFAKTVVNDNFGTAAAGDFTFELVSDPAGTPAATAHVAGEAVELQVGAQYAVREVAAAGYDTVSTVCLTDEGSASGAVDVVVDPTGFTPSVGDSQIVCTFVNDDEVLEIPLSVTKQVINDDGGVAVPADFPITVTIGGAATTVATGDTVQLASSAAVVVSESPPSGYTLASITCRDSAGDDLGSAFIPTPTMEAIDCVIVNDDVAATTSTSPTTSVPLSTSPGTIDTTPTTPAPVTSATTSPGATAPAATAPEQGPSAQLPATGGSPSGPIGLALAALAAGAALVTVARRRTV